MASFRRLVPLIALLAALCLSGCKTPKTLWIPGVIADNYPRVDGSTSTRPLGDLLLAQAMGLPGELRRDAMSARYASERSAQVVFPVSVTVDDLRAFQQRLDETSSHRGTHAAYINLLQNPPMERASTAPLRNRATPPLTLNPYSVPPQLILVATPPSADELEAAKKLGIAYDVRPIGRDAFVFIVNVENPVTGLTLAQARDIYSGKITNWKTVGGKDEPILAYARDRNSGSQELMEALVMRGQPIIITRRDMISDSMSGAINSIARTENGLGYTVYYYQSVMVPDRKIRLLAVDGVLPSSASIADGSYPLINPIYAVTRTTLDPTSPAAKLRDWLLTPDGQRLIADSGYVPLPRGK